MLRTELVSRLLKCSCKSSTQLVAATISHGILVLLAACAGYDYVRIRPVIVGTVDGDTFSGKLMTKDEQGITRDLPADSDDLLAINWDFGDGDSYRQEDERAVVKHTYSSTGTYVIVARRVYPGGDTAYNLDGDRVAAKLSITVPALGLQAEN